MTQVQKFLRGLNDFASVCKEDLTGMRFKEQNLNSNYKDLQIGVKRSILSNKPKINKAYESPLALRRRLFPSERRLPPPPKEKRQAQSDMALRPAPFPTRYYALRAQPCQAAKRFYQPRALIQRQEEKLEQIDDYIRYPSQEGAAGLDGKIDPALHIGNFDVDEFKWGTPIGTQVI
ncbi:hypothetical protein M9Y10_037907 [Tritrichomonas musculus]|uniref:Uncharacterized protein n=1 Tax=Tritrichomonas musculus TaxID=1915356 RepID=A0ABR2K700_9EUKA